MKKIYSLLRFTLFNLLLIGALLTIPPGIKANATAGVPVNANATQATKNVLSYLNTLSNTSFNGVVSGQWFTGADLSDGYLNGYSHYITGLYNVSSKWAGMATMDSEYSREYSPTELLDANDCLVQHWNKGGLVTVAWSPTSPAGGDANGTKVADLTRLITPTDPYYPIWIAKLDRIAGMLKDLQNRGVVVLWRPMQEMNGTGFWWAKSTITESNSDYVAVWQHMYNYFTTTKGLNNLIWVFGPVQDYNWSSYPYPGDAYVDIVGGTMYNDPLSINGYAEQVTRPKVLAMSELGPNNGLGTFDDRLYVNNIRSSYPQEAYFSAYSNWTGFTMSLVDNANASLLMNDSGIVNCPVPWGGSAGSDTVPPSIPTNFASPSKTANSVNLTWTASTGSPAGYDIFTITPPGAWPSGVCTRSNPALGSVTATSYTITGLKSGVAYDIRVRAVDAAGNQSGTAAITVTTNTGGGSPPDPPTLLTATAGAAQVSLIWTGSAGATSYNVKRSTVSGSGYATVASPTGTSYTNTGLANGATYYYVATAVSSGGESGLARQAKVTLSGLAAPTGLTATAGNGQAALSWNASSGATSYTVKRSTVSGSGYVNVASPTATNYTNTGLTNGTIYYFVVSATNSGGTSANSAQASARPAAPSGISINAGGLASGSFIADADFTGGAAATNNTGTVDTSAVTSPAPTAVYQSERYGASFTYTVPALNVGAGYKVRLHFTEDYWTAAGKRLENVTLNGTQVLTSFDIYQHAGAAHKANIQEFYTTANSSGQVVAAFGVAAGSTDTNAKVDGIEVLPASETAINSGGPAAGNYIGDANFSGGTAGTNNTGAVDLSAVNSPAPSAVYQSERYGATFSYTIGGLAANSSHTVRLHFTEDYWTASGSRVENVTINGAASLTNFDIFATAGTIHKANIQQFTVNANASGQYVIVFTAVTGHSDTNAKVDGIEVI